jgi:cytochrome c oxidase assembly protein subunit 15
VATVAGLAFLVIAGGIVRLTGSGLGCDDWPSCNQSSFVDVSSTHTAIEQVNRLLSGVIAVPTVLMVIGAFRVRPRRRGLAGPSIGVFLSVFANAVVGGLAVLGDLHPALIQSHFVLAMISIGFAMVAVHRSQPDPVSRAGAEELGRGVRSLFAAVGVLSFLALVTGTVVTGTGPHAGDETARRWGFDISTVAEIHSLTVWSAVAAVLALVLVLRRRGLHARFAGALSTWMFVAVIQGGIGYVQYFSGVPEVLVGAHIAGAAALWVATLRLVLAGLEPSMPDASGVHGPETQREQEIAVSPFADA